MNGISRREFAKRDGCDEKLVRKGLSRGDLVAFDDGTIDPSLVGTPWRKRNADGPRKGSASAPDDKRDETLVSHSEASRRKENYLARLRQLEFEIKSGKLVDADAAKKAVFDLSRQDRDSWANWPSRVAPLIAAEMGVDLVKLAVVLEKHVREQLAERAQPALRIAS